MAKMFENPPPLKITCSQAPSGSKTVELGFTCVAPTLVMNGQVPGKDGENIFAEVETVPSGFRQRLFRPATPRSPEECRTDTPKRPS